MTNSAIFVIVPVYNEAGIVRETITPLVEAGYTVVVVDDGSSDGSLRTLAGLPVVLLRHAVNLGQGAALETGMEYALRHGAEAAVHFDADGQHRWEQIPDLIAPIERGEADIVLGSRFLRREDAAQTPALRRMLLRAGIIVSGLFSGLWLTDTHNGFRALSRKALQEIELRENGFAHATEILASVRRKKLRYVEVPTAIRYSAYSRAKGQSFWNSFNVVIDLLMEKLFR
jgi:polyprenyl-phospho-N-acetylgalactosaminyl synthase